MKMKQFAFFLICLFLSATAFSATVDTINTYSPSMKKSIKAVVVLPDSYSADKNFPVIYLLHGYGGNYASWITLAPKIKDYADDYAIIFVCPDGNVSSWYYDSPVDSSWKYETYVSTELVNFIDGKYKTMKDRKARGITGLSMGGHGAFYLAFKHQDVYGVAGSMSGGVDIRPFPLNWEIVKRLGSYAEFPERWEQNTVINLVHLLTPKSLALIFDCGTEDFFYRVNTDLHQKLLQRNIPHDFTSRPGAHNGDYWKNAIEYQVIFMKNYFAQ